MNNKENFKKKINGFLKLIRCKNIPYTLLLSFSSGFIINKSFFELFNSKMFMISTLITVLIMSCSMIINDLFDINIDKINNSNRPLINGDIKIYEAVFTIFILLGFSEYLSLKYLTNNLQIIVNIAILIISIYTPILKKILFIKNISCALLISFSTYFSALSSIYNYKNIETKNIYILIISSCLIFLGSLYNELLLDMVDCDGDRLNNINTVPVVYGLKFSWNLANFILKFNILLNTLNLMLLFNIREGLLLLYILYPLIINLKNIKKYNYIENNKNFFLNFEPYAKENTNNIIIKAVKESGKPLFLSLIYLCILSI
jgi:4-hydroxybenzoate polyprenyltransferase